MANIKFNAKNFPKLELGNILSWNSQLFSLISKVSYNGKWYEWSTEGWLSYIEWEWREDIANELYYFSYWESSWYEDGENGTDIEWEICRLIPEDKCHFNILFNNEKLVLLYDQIIINELPTEIWNRATVTEVNWNDDQRIGDEMMIYEFNYNWVNYQIELYNHQEIIKSSWVNVDFCTYEQLKYKWSGDINSAQSDVPVLKFMDSVMWKWFIAISALAIWSIITMMTAFEPSKVETSSCDIKLWSMYLLESNYNEYLWSRTCSWDEDTRLCYDYKEYKWMSFTVESQEDKDLITKFIWTPCWWIILDIELPSSMMMYRTYYAQWKLYEITWNYRVFELIKKYWYWWIFWWAWMAFAYLILIRFHD